MSGDRQWVIEGSPHRHENTVPEGPLLEMHSQVRVVEASRLTAVEAERDAYRETLKWYRAAADEMRGDPIVSKDEQDIADEAATRADAVLERFPKQQNETEQG